MGKFTGNWKVGRARQKQTLTQDVAGVIQVTFAEGNGELRVGVTRATGTDDDTKSLRKGESFMLGCKKDEFLYVAVRADGDKANGKYSFIPTN